MFRSGPNIGLQMIDEQQSAISTNTTEFPQRFGTRCVWGQNRRGASLILLLQKSGQETPAQGTPAELSCPGLHSTHRQFPTLPFQNWPSGDSDGAAPARDRRSERIETASRDGAPDSDSPLEPVRIPSPKESGERTTAAVGSSSERAFRRGSGGLAKAVPPFR